MIVLDRMMPKMDGIIPQYYQGRPKIRGIPVVMQTAATLAEQVRHGIEAGADYYLSKPYDHAELLGMVNSSLVRKFNSELKDASKGFRRTRAATK